LKSVANGGDWPGGDAGRKRNTKFGQSTRKTQVAERRVTTSKSVRNNRVEYGIKRSRQEEKKGDLWIKKKRAQREKKGSKDWKKIQGPGHRQIFELNLSPEKKNKRVLGCKRTSPEGSNPSGKDTWKKKVLIPVGNSNSGFFAKGN